MRIIDVYGGIWTLVGKNTDGDEVWLSQGQLNKLDHSNLTLDYVKHWHGKSLSEIIQYAGPVRFEEFIINEEPF